MVPPPRYFVDDCTNRDPSTGKCTYSPTSPFYDKVPGATIERWGNWVWFSDEPYGCENINNCSQEGPEDHGESVSFGVYLASDKIENGKHVVTIYGGRQWGYDYTNSDTTPEPSSILLFGSGILVLAGLLRRKLF